MSAPEGYSHTITQIQCFRLLRVFVYSTLLEYSKNVSRFGKDEDSESMGIGACIAEPAKNGTDLKKVRD